MDEDLSLAYCAAGLYDVARRFLQIFQRARFLLAILLIADKPRDSSAKILLEYYPRVRAKATL